jgi:uncharacterized protein Yka (UPF0111/DUF47 family)
MKAMYLPRDLETKLDEYRRQRKEETGKRPFRYTAILELLKKALAGVEPEKPLTKRIEEIEDRLDLIEREMPQ